MQSTPPSRLSSPASFSKHGEYVIELNGCVIKAELKGIATQKMLQQYHDDVLMLTGNLDGAQWGFIGSIFGTGVLTPEAEEWLVVSIKRRMELGMLASVVIADRAKVPALVVRQFERVFQQAGIKYLFCSSEQEGLDWLSSLGCKAN
ncbi:hypothetical protein KUL152_23000 [Tenacibaculum sp. KUL152]|nr:hypothetical protein KUL152_23000 [Tenacibaculum sp. KUL152]